MPSIKLTGFSGEQPRIIKRLLPEAGAQRAIDVRLDDGGLTPFRQPAQVAVAAGASHKTIYLHENEWLSWEADVDVCPGPVATDRLYYTGDGAPKMRVSGATYPLAVPFPAVALTATLGGTGVGSVATRTYVYTWVTSFGEESEPSPAAVSVDWKPGNTVTLTGFAATPAGRGITLQRIYRTQTGSVGTGLYLIAERAASAGSYVDTVAVNDFREPIPSLDWNAPPAELMGLTTMANGIMAGFVGKDLYFCDPYHPHAWPEKYSLTLDYEIVAIAASQTSLMVTTTGRPSLVVGAHPDSMQEVKLEAQLPCINKRSMVDLGFAVCYASTEGLVAMRADGSIQLISGALFSREAWLQLSPATMVAGQFSNRYVAFYEASAPDGSTQAGALFIDVGATPYLLRSSSRASAVFFDVKSSNLYYLEPGSTKIFQIDPPDNLRATLYWRSKAFVLPYPETFGAILIDIDPDDPGSQGVPQEVVQAIIVANQAAINAGTVLGAVDTFPMDYLEMNGDTLQPLPGSSVGTTVGIYADGVRVDEVQITGKPARIVGGFLARQWEIDVSGDQKVSQIVLGRTIDDLKYVQ